MGLIRSGITGESPKPGPNPTGLEVSDVDPHPEARSEIGMVSLECKRWFLVPDTFSRHGIQTVVFGS
jgi:hypothetical protein